MLKLIGDVFIDTSTGEIINPLDYGCLPDDYDVSNAVTEALTGIPQEGSNTTAEIKSGRGRKPKTLVNHYCSLFQNLERKDLTTTAEIKTKSVAVMPSVLDDIFTGALRLNTDRDNTEIPREQLLFVLAHLEHLSVESITELFTAKRALKGDDIPKERYCRYLLRKCETVINSIGYHLDKGSMKVDSSFDFRQDYKAFNTYGSLPFVAMAKASFTEGDREVIRRLAKAGRLEEAYEYIKGVSEQLERMIERINLPSLNQVEREMIKEFPYDPYRSGDN